MIKIGEHITLDFLGVKKDYSPDFYEKVIYKIAKAAKLQDHAAPTRRLSALAARQAISATLARGIRRSRECKRDPHARECVILQ